MEKKKKINIDRYMNISDQEMEMIDDRKKDR